eukprot:TRINITY_DN2660_c0_g1_i9.p2 TRINITY_DN2660_c0_g1~~TRINITY_DN2660_c0_g1_i9.p2  ORF type:complete len:137 (+),score=41.55 TRINITY_DN2660_c0_g1_i9:802-1212(+)
MQFSRWMIPTHPSCIMGWDDMVAVSLNIHFVIRPLFYRRPTTTTTATATTTTATTTATATATTAAAATATTATVTINATVTAATMALPLTTAQRPHRSPLPGNYLSKGGFLSTVAQPFKASIGCHHHQALLLPPLR